MIKQPPRFLIYSSIAIMTIITMAQHSYCQKIHNRGHTNLKQYINCVFFAKMITNENMFDSICGIADFINKPYSNDSVGINRFIAYTLCASESHLTGIEEYESYFGSDDISKWDINQPHVRIGNLGSLAKCKRLIYITTALQFINDHLEEFNNSHYIHPIEGYYTLFQAILQDIRQNNYRNLNQYIPALIQLYTSFEGEYLLKDMVLDTIRKSHDPEALEFLKDRYFLSDDFNSKEFIHAYDSIGDKGYIKYVKQQK